jgi:hypothetical protein
MLNNNFDNIFEIKNLFPNEQVCIYHLERIRWNGTVISPFDIDSKVYKCKKNTYKCKNSGKYFNVKTGTLFDSSKIPLQKWFIAIWLVTYKKPSINSVDLAFEIDINQKSAWLMLKKVKECYNLD